jgi:hypothetical protein
MPCVSWAQAPGQAFSVLSDLAEEGQLDLVDEIMAIAAAELAIPTALSYIEGPTIVPGVYWRRCIRRRDADHNPLNRPYDDEADVSDAPNQYILYYRESGVMDHEEGCTGLPCFRVEMLLHNTQAAGVDSSAASHPA